MRYWKTQLDKLKKASKNKDKITLHKGKKLTEETIETDALLLDFIKINSKIGIPITTISVNLELLRIRPDLSKLSSHGIYEYI